MKKVIAIVLVCVLCLSLAACGKKDDQGETSGSGETTNTTNNTKKEYADGENIVTGYKSGDVTLGQYTGLTYTPLSTEVTEEEVQTQLEKYADSYKTKVEVTDRETVQEGDLVDISYMGIMDGTAFQGGTGSITDLQIGSNKFIPGFEDALIGKTKGSFSIDVTFPSDYRNSDLAGKPATFNITLNGIYKYEVPELTDDFVKEKTSGKYETVEAYREYTHQQLKAQKEADAENQKMYDIIQKLIDNTTYNIDMEAEIQRGVSSLKAYNDDALSAYGMDSVGYYQTYLGLSEEQYMEMLRASAELSVRYEYARSAVAEAERFQVTDEEINELATTQSKQYAYASVDDYYAKLKELYGIEGKVYIEEQVKLNKASNLILDTAIPVEE